MKTLFSTLFMLTLWAVQGQFYLDATELEVSHLEDEWIVDSKDDDATIFTLTDNFKYLISETNGKVTTYKIKDWEYNPEKKTIYGELYNTSNKKKYDMTLNIEYEFLMLYFDDDNDVYTCHSYDYTSKFPIEIRKH